MADHRAEQIMQAFVAALGTTSEFVTLRAPQDDVNQFPSVSVYMGSESPLGETGYEIPHTYSAVLNVVCVVSVRSTTPETALNAAKKALHIAIFQDQRLGLPFVIETMLSDADEPEIDDDGEGLLAQQTVNYEVKYRTSVADRSA